MTLTRHVPLRRKTPLRPSRKPISRLGRVGRKRLAGMRAAKAFMPPYCQLCSRTDRPLAKHHKLKRSEGGDEKPENLISLCWGQADGCHERTHADRKLFERVKESKASLANQEMVV